MKFDGSIEEMIKLRTSWRKYAGRVLEENTRKDLESVIAKPLIGPFGNGIRFRLLERLPADNNENVRFGTYGFISGARNFMAGAVKDGDMALEDYGYAAEKLVLFCTSLGLATCWLGGTFKRSEFAHAMELKDDEILPAVIALGYPVKKRGTRDKLMRLFVGSKNRKPWDEIFFSGDFEHPLSPKDAADMSVPLEMLRLAPSASNRQPWRILRTGNSAGKKDSEKYHFYLKRTKHYEKIVKRIDLQRIDMGIAMTHFEMTAHERGLNGQWKIENPGIELHEGMEYTVTWCPA